MSANGFMQLGGAVLTSAVVYLATAQVARQTQRNSATLQDSRKRLDALLEPAKGPVKPIPRRYDTSLSETVRQRWNDELEGIWKWSSRLDSTIIREHVEVLTADLIANTKGNKETPQATGG
jgi:hypothetical protein